MWIWTLCLSSGKFMSVVCIKSLRNTQGVVDVVDVRTDDSTLDDEFIEAHANDARCIEGVDD